MFSWAKYITNVISVTLIHLMLNLFDHLMKVQADHTVLNWVIAFGWVIIYNISKED